MTESVSSEELALGRHIRAYADAGSPARDPDLVVRAIIAKSPPRPLRLPRALTASASVLLLVAVFAVASFGQMGSSPATAQVGGITVGGVNLGGTTYGVGVARSIDLSGARLTVAGEARQDSGFRTQGLTVYQVDDVDPRQILVMKLAPGERDDGGPIGDFLVLARGDGYSLLCPYVEPGDPLAPAECH
ncbi:MAG: hypothetical protein M3406_12275 [Chloroflexota bacterium]|nr:hypothetical protein [Chloroflexota bacterium]